MYLQLTPIPYFNHKRAPTGRNITAVRDGAGFGVCGRRTELHQRSVLTYVATLICLADG